MVMTMDRLTTAFHRMGRRCSCSKRASKERDRPSPPDNGTRSSPPETGTSVTRSLSELRAGRGHRAAGSAFRHGHCGSQQEVGTPEITLQSGLHAVHHVADGEPGVLVHHDEGAPVAPPEAGTGTD